MSQSLKLVQKPPVVFYLVDPAVAFSSCEIRGLLSRGLGEERTFLLLWAQYCRFLLSQVEPCMEANEGAKITVEYLLKGSDSSGTTAIWEGEDCCILRRGDAVLYLQGAADKGDVMLYFLPPDHDYSYREACRIDLSDYGSDAAAQFVAATLGSWGKVRNYFISLCA